MCVREAICHVPAIIALVISILRAGCSLEKSTNVRNVENEYLKKNREPEYLWKQKT